MKKLFFAFLALLMAVSLLAGCDKGASSLIGKPEEAYQFKSGDLANYVIVYAGDNPDYFDLAYQLNDWIYTQYGHILTTVRDTNAEPVKYEILLGDTNRSDPTGSVMEYSVTVEDGKFRINAGGSFSAEKAVEFLCQHLFNGQEFALDSGEYYHTSFLSGTQQLSEGTDVRIMTANVLADAFADTSYRKAHYRAEIFAGMLVTYTPDVLGLQETDENWNAILDTYLAKIRNTHGIAYERLLATHQDQVNYTSLLYRSDKLQPENSDVYVFNWWMDETFHHNYHMRNISWAHFSSLEDPGKTFIVANTHWSYRTEHADGYTRLSHSDAPIAVNQLREQCKDETNTFLSGLRQIYPDTPIFLTGDFNTSLSFFTDSGWTPSYFRIISEEARKDGKSISLVPTSGHFDHIFGFGNYSILLYGFFNDTDHHNLLTDHPFAYVDLCW